MKALILNSGMGSRMGVLTCEHPKCMTEISSKETIISRQLRLLAEYNINDVVITTGYFDEVLINYCNSLEMPLNITFVKNPLYDRTNYIYSIYCAKDYLDDDIILMHGDLVFEESVMEAVVNSEKSCMTVSSTLPLPEKDFKAVIEGDRVKKVGIEFFDNAFAAQAFYKIKKEDWLVWLNKISEFCEKDVRSCYAENAFNEVSDVCKIHTLDVKDALCNEIDNAQDLEMVVEMLKKVESRIVYMGFSADIIHSGHIEMIKKAKKLGKLIVGVLTDDAVASYKKQPFVPYSERRELINNIKGVYDVVEQKTLSYAEILRTLKPDFVVHGDDWKNGIQKDIRDEVLSVLSEYGGTLMEYPYSEDEKYKIIESLSKQN